MATRWQLRLRRAVGLRVVVRYAVVFAVSASLVGVIAYELLDASLRRRDHDLLRIKLAEYSERYESGGLPALSQAISGERTSGDPDSVLVRLVARNADVLLVSEPPGWPSFQFAQVGDGRPPSSDGWLIVPSTSRDMQLEVASRPLFDGTFMQVGRTTVARDRLLADVRALFGLLVVVVIAAGLAGGVALTRQALRPLRDLRDTVRRIAETGEFGARVDAASDGDLVEQLGQVFNQMLGQIETLVDGMRGALDNVAHDLRTPIARLRARAEAALSAPGEEGRSRAALADCIEEADRVIALLSTLMDISEAETGTMRLSLGRVSVREVAAETVDLYEDGPKSAGSRCRRTCRTGSSCARIANASARRSRISWTTRSSTPSEADVWRSAHATRASARSRSPSPTRASASRPRSSRESGAAVSGRHGAIRAGPGPRVEPRARDCQRPWRTGVGRERGRGGHDIHAHAACCVACGRALVT